MDIDKAYQEMLKHGGDLFDAEAISLLDLLHAEWRLDWIHLHFIDLIISDEGVDERTALLIEFFDPFG